MIEGIRQVHLGVPDLATARRWYTVFLEVEPYLSDDTTLTFSVDGFLFEITVSNPMLAAPVIQEQHHPIVGSSLADSNGPLVYWGVDDLRGELARLLEAGIQMQAPIQSPHPDTKMALFRDPFGNRIGLLEKPDPQVLRARSQRSAEQIALRKVRAALDDINRTDAGSRNTIIAICAVLAVVLLLGGYYMRTRVADLQMGQSASEFLKTKP